MEANESTGVSGDLTSTVESVLTNNGHEKKINHSDSISVGDSTPSSSSDANMQTSVVKTIHDDPISSTSDSLSQENEMNLNILAPDLNFVAGVETSGSVNDLGADADFFTSELSIESMSTEKISEDVEDIANDLENLLGETTQSYGVICSNSVVTTKTDEKVKEISTSNISISENIIVGSNIETETAADLLRGDGNQLGAQHDKDEATTSKDVVLCSESKTLDENEKTDISLENNPVDNTDPADELSITGSRSKCDGKVEDDDVSERTSADFINQTAQLNASHEDKQFCMEKNDTDNVSVVDELSKENCEEKDIGNDNNDGNVVILDKGNMSNTPELIEENQKVIEEDTSGQILSAEDVDENSSLTVERLGNEIEVKEVFLEIIPSNKEDTSNEVKLLEPGNIQAVKSEGEFPTGTNLRQESDECPISEVVEISEETLSMDKTHEVVQLISEQLRAEELPDKIIENVSNEVFTIEQDTGGKNSTQEKEINNLESMEVENFPLETDSGINQVDTSTEKDLTESICMENEEIVHSKSEEDNIEQSEASICSSQEQELETESSENTILKTEEEKVQTRFSPERDETIIRQTSDVTEENQMETEVSIETIQQEIPVKTLQQDGHEEENCANFTKSEEAKAMIDEIENINLEGDNIPNNEASGLTACEKDEDIVVELTSIEDKNLETTEEIPATTSEEIEGNDEKEGVAITVEEKEILTLDENTNVCEETADKVMPIEDPAKSQSEESTAFNQDKLGSPRDCFEKDIELGVSEVKEDPDIGNSNITCGEGAESISSEPSVPTFAEGENDNKNLDESQAAEEIDKNDTPNKNVTSGIETVRSPNEHASETLLNFDGVNTMPSTQEDENIEIQVESNPATVSELDVQDISKEEVELVQLPQTTEDDSGETSQEHLEISESLGEGINKGLEENRLNDVSQLPCDNNETTCVSECHKEQQCSIDANLSNESNAIPEINPEKNQVDKDSETDQHCEVIIDGGKNSSSSPMEVSSEMCPVEAMQEDISNIEEKSEEADLEGNVENAEKNIEENKSLATVLLKEEQEYSLSNEETEVCDEGVGLKVDEESKECSKKDDEAMIEELHEIKEVESTQEDTQELSGTSECITLNDDSMVPELKELREVRQDENSEENEVSKTEDVEISQKLIPMDQDGEVQEDMSDLNKDNEESCKEDDDKRVEDSESSKIDAQENSGKLDDALKDQDNAGVLECKTPENIVQVHDMSSTHDHCERGDVIQEVTDSCPNISESVSTMPDGVETSADIFVQDCMQEDTNFHQHNLQPSIEILDKEHCQTNLEDENLLELKEQDISIEVDKSSEIQEFSQKNDCDTEIVNDEPSELQCAISQIVEDIEPTDHSEAAELESAISHIISSPETIHDPNLNDHHAEISQIIDSSETIEDPETFELQNAISQIVYSTETTDDSKSTELQSAISQIIDDSETAEDSELQNAITQIIITPELEHGCKNDSGLDTPMEQNVVEDTLEDEIEEIAGTSTDQNHQKEDDVLFDGLKQSQQEEIAETEAALKTIEKEVKLDETEEKAHSEIEMQTLYSQPVVDLMLEDMDDQLKNVIFESKSDDSISNIPTISEVDLDTPKTFESQHMDLILPEETSLLNTDDIISEITPSNENIVGFSHEDDLKLQTQVTSDDDLKISELHANDSKDINDVIAREIESLLELQTHDLPSQTSTIDNDPVDEGIKIINEESQISIEEKVTDVMDCGSTSYEQTAESDNKLSQESKRVAEISNEVDFIEKGQIEKKQDEANSTESDFNKSGLDTVLTNSSIGEISSTSVANVESINQEVDNFIDSTEVIEKESDSAKEIGAPLVIEVEERVQVEEKDLEPSTQVVEIPASKYSSKISENEDLKMTITKHKIESTSKTESPVINETHSILKIYDPKDTVDSKKMQKAKETIVPKLIIKPIVRSQSSPTSLAKLDEVEQTVPKLYIRNMSPNRPSSPKVVKSQKSEITSPLKLTIKPVLKPEECQPKSSPKLTIKPIVKSEEESSSTGPKITIKPIIKPTEDELCHSPKITIKPIIKPDDCQSEMVHSPRITIKPIPKPDDAKEYISDASTQSPRITIKPVIKPEERNSPDQELILKKVTDIDGADRSHSPRITIKPIVKPDEHRPVSKQDQKLKQDEFSKTDKKDGSPKITIKPIVKPAENEPEPIELIDFEEQIKQERIVLKINKNSMGKESRKRDSTEDIEKLAKIKLKFSKEGGHAHIVSEQSKLKRALEETLDCDQKRAKFESEDLSIIPIDGDMRKTEKVVDIVKDDVNITPITPINRPSLEDPLEKIPVFEITPESAVMMKNTVTSTVQQVVTPTPRKRGRPRKVPLVVREEFKDAKEEEVPQQQEQQQPAPEETGRPKRSCRGPSVRTTLGIRTRKPRGSGRGRGRGRVARGVGSRGGRQQRVSAAKLKLLKEEAAAAIAEQSQSLEPEDGGDIEMKEESSVVEDVTSETAEIVLIEEETRMSAEINTSRAQTPAKQVDNSAPTPGDVEDTQSSVQSTATTESTKTRRNAKHEIHQEPEGEVISADQLTEYYWGGGGPYMLQEQVAQFLGIKSFKRKYPGIQRRTVDMQERDFIRETGLVSEAMCDLGLTAVHSADILDILYSDFQQKYEEYCKHQRDRQAKDFSNKQKALSLAASQEKNRHDVVQQSVQSAASWNTNFNKSRREERKACMDLQTFTVHYPKGRFKTAERGKTGHYPVALVPGQYTDYYKSFTPTELSNLPINTMLDKPINVPTEEESPSEGSGSESDSSSSDSDSSSSSSTDEDCNICSPTSSNQTKKVLAN